jgi:hypothetical protein
MESTTLSRLKAEARLALDAQRQLGAEKERVISQLRASLELLGIRDPIGAVTAPGTFSEHPSSAPGMRR